MPIIPVIVALIIVGVCLYIITLIPMDPTFKTIIRVIVIALVLLWVLSLFVPMGTWGLGTAHTTIANPCYK